MGMTKTEVPKEITDQIKRLKGYHGWEDLRGELEQILWREGHSDEHRKRILDEILTTRKREEKGFATCPVVSEMIDYCRSVSPEAPPNFQEPDAKCKCGGLGWISFQRKINGDLYDYAAPCQCRKAVAR
jgi:hypothetical protein